MLDNKRQTIHKGCYLKRLNGTTQGLRPRTRGAIICLPHAGGSAGFFRTWAASVPKDITLFGVQYPGREERMHELSIENMDELVQGIAPSLVGLSNLPYVLFGHSMGAAVAFELAGKLEKMGLPASLLMMSSHPPLDEIIPSHFHQCSDDELWREMIRIGGTSPDILQQTELTKLLTPVLRADYQLIETYQSSATQKLSTRMLICLGDNDPDVPAENIHGWQRFSQQPISILEKQGGHFYLNDHQASLIDEAVNAINGLMFNNIRDYLP